MKLAAGKEDSTVLGATSYLIRLSNVSNGYVVGTGSRQKSQLRDWERIATRAVLKTAIIAGGGGWQQVLGSNVVF